MMSVECSMMHRLDDAGMQKMQVCLDTASFEVVHNCWQTLLSILKDGLVDLLLCNEAEALAVAQLS